MRCRGRIKVPMAEMHSGCRIVESKHTPTSALQAWVHLDSYMMDPGWFAMRNFLEENSFLEQPLTITGAGLSDGGLLIHTAYVVNNALLLRQSMNAPFSKSDVILAAVGRCLNRFGWLTGEGDVVLRYRRCPSDRSIWDVNPEFMPYYNAQSAGMCGLAFVRRFIKLPEYLEGAISGNEMRRGALMFLTDFANVWALDCQESDEGWKSYRLKDKTSKV